MKEYAENELLYYNEYGGFTKDGKEYVISTAEKTTPLPWSHVIANENFGTIVTANGGGYIWHKNSQANKITTWSNDALKDTPSEKLQLQLGDELLNLLPYNSLKNYKVVYGFGYAKFFYENENVKLETFIYVPINKSKKVYSILIKSKNESLENCHLIYQMSPVLGVTREFTKKHIVIEKENNMVLVKNKYREFYSDDDVYIKTSDEIVNFSDENSEVFIDVALKNSDNIFVQLEVQCENDELQNVQEDLLEIKKFWHDKMSKVNIFTPVDSMNIMMNGWLLYQTLCCRMWARTSFYQAGGAFGFRDQLQDSLALLWFDASLTKKQILCHAMHQFEEGDVLHWWHPEKNNGTRTRYTDDLLWLPYVLCKYCDFTGDYSILDEEVPFVKAEKLRDDEIERYTDTSFTNYSATIYEHAKKAIDYGVKIDKNGLPKMGNGDWNDGMNRIGGQSIWLGFFIYDVLNNFKKICEVKDDNVLIEKYEKVLHDLRIALNENGWDGKWFRRAYFENGIPLGSTISEECKIDGISQSWAVISGAGEYDKCVQALNGLDSYLVDKENMIIKLLTPPFDKSEMNPGYIKAYIPGVRENGGQYTHGAIWSIIANAMLLNGDRASEYFRIINPIEHARTKEGVLKFKVEPYVVPADVYASPSMLGRGGWTWYTGSSSWLYIAGLEYILGVTIHGNIMKIKPCISPAWKEFRVEYTYGKSKYVVDVKNPELKSTGISAISLDNNFINSNEIELIDDQKVHTVEVVM